MSGLRQFRREGVIILPFNSSKSKALIIGKTLKIEKGSDIDIVYLDVGYGPGESMRRKLVVKNVQARKQLATLKHNVFTLVWGELPAYNPNGKNEMLIHALAFWSAYVPNHYDRVELEKEQEQEEQVIVEKLEEIEEKEITGDFLSQFENL